MQQVSYRLQDTAALQAAPQSGGQTAGFFFPFADAASLTIFELCYQGITFITVLLDACVPSSGVHVQLC